MSILLYYNIEMNDWDFYSSSYEPNSISGDYGSSRGCGQVPWRSEFSLAFASFSLMLFGY